jgi:hypothetical protein
MLDVIVTVFLGLAVLESFIRDLCPINITQSISPVRRHEQPAIL